MTDRTGTAVERAPVCSTCGGETEPSAGVWWCASCGRVAREIDCCE